MPQLFTTIISHLAIALLFFLYSNSGTKAYAAGTVPHMDLALSFEINENLLRGTARLMLPARQAITLYLSELTVTGAIISHPGKENQHLILEENGVLTLPAAKYNQILLLSYEKKITDSHSDIISDKGIALTSAWHPFAGRKMTFTLEALVPKGFTAVSESDIFSRTDSEGNARFSFSQPVNTLTFAAAPYVIQSHMIREGLTLYTLFFSEDGPLAGGYLEAAAGYIRRYEESIGTFPYNHYIIAENIRPTGIGLPTFTLLGRQVVRLPFIKQTSLGHEILHSWFGNSVDVDHHSGNWCEGLTTYLADMAYRTESGEGALSRKETIQNYISYVTDTTPALRDFVSAGHDHSSSRALRAVGYSRSAMLFHQLYVRVGSKTFWTVIRRLYQEFNGQSASWDDLQHLFESEASEPLGSFFSQQLTRIDLPDIVIEDLRSNQGTDTATLSFTVRQRTPEPYELLLPFMVQTITGDQFFTRLINDEKTSITVTLDSLPLNLIIDPAYDVMRRLSQDERAPVLSDILGSDNTIVILSDESLRDTFEPFIDMAAGYSWKVETTTSMTLQDTGEATLVFLGTDNEISRSLFGQQEHTKAGFTLDMRFNPLNVKRVIGLISSSSRSETEAVVRRLKHYGKYSFLHFVHGQNVEKKITPHDMGIKMLLQEKPSGLSVSSLSEFEHLAAQIKGHRAVYVGETHTSWADHMLQLMLIETLHRQNPNLSIGMEMFPQSSQQALDDYVRGDTSESTFLKQSRYYDVWRYDYRLFRPIFAYARKHRIPVIGLNIDRNIVSSVFKSGSTAALAPANKELLPVDRNLDLPGYTDRLRQIHAMHTRQQHAEGSLAGFIQAQALWDESMAETISTYLISHPDTQMIILAGSQHTRKDSGIPPRVASRLDISQATINNMATSRLNGREFRATTDYLFAFEVEDLAPQGKIGVVLQENSDGPAPEMEIIDINPNSHAAASGIRKQDIIIKIAHYSIGSMADVRVALLNTIAGDTISVVVKRVGQDNMAQEHTFDIMLFDPESTKPHP